MPLVNLEFTPLFKGVRVTRSLVVCVYLVDRCLSFCPFSFVHCVSSNSSNLSWLLVIPSRASCFLLLKNFKLFGFSMFWIGAYILIIFVLLQMTINEYIYIIFFGYVEPSKIEQTYKAILNMALITLHVLHLFIDGTSVLLERYKMYFSYKAVY